MRSLPLLALATLALAGCGDDVDANKTGSCTFGAPQPSCFEYTNATADELSQDASPMCANDHGTFANTACSRNNALGGCRSDIVGPHGPFTQTVWFYPGGTVATAADVMARCPNLGGEFVAP